MMRRRVVRVFIAVAVALVVGANVLISLTGCSAISSGTITRKEYRPAYETSVLTCGAYGKYGCTLWIPIPEHEPASYRLDIRNGDKSGWVDVDQTTYDQEKVGDWWGGRS
ncbi:hypothetical protein [Leifsonia sp. P73]|uniref:hypothetical protein n=1 Tax=Leifsonia sp. P73 TaxID=3423959 RepID=UPI003DA3A4C6